MRHGKTKWNIEGKYQGWMDSPLLPESRIDTEIMAKSLKNKDIDTIISSPLKRSRDTAEIVSNILGIEYEISKNLIECNHGRCEGLTAEESRILFPNEMMSREKDKWNYPWPNGESYCDVYFRAKNFVDNIDDSKTYLIISHEIFNKCLIGYLLNWDKSKIIGFKQKNSSTYMINLDNIQISEVNI